METNFCGDVWGWNGNSAGMSGDGSETGQGQLGMKIKYRRVRDGCNFCAHAGLLS